MLLQFNKLLCFFLNKEWNWVLFIYLFFLFRPSSYHSANGTVFYAFSFLKENINFIRGLNALNHLPGKQGSSWSALSLRYFFC